MSSKQLSFLFFSLLISILPVAGYSDDFSDSFSLKGFYTLDLSYALDGDRRLGTSKQAALTLEENELSTDNSVIGLQLDWQILDSLAFTAQAVSTGQTNGDYEPELDWVYLTYDFGSDLLLRAGKRKVPFYQGAELRYVGFSRLWAHPLVPDSGAGGFDRYDGIELSKSYHLDNYNLTFQGAYGKTEHELESTEGDDLFLLSTQIDNEFGLIKLVVLQTEFDVYTPRTPSRNRRLIEKNAKALMGSLEMELNLDSWIIDAGYSYENIDINPDGRFMYLGIGYQAGRFTPYIVAQDSKLDFDQFTSPRRPGPPGPPGPPPPRSPDGEINATSYAAGVRYEMSPNMALKMQVEHWQEKSQIRSSEPELEQQSTLFTLTVEGVF